MTSINSYGGRPRVDTIEPQAQQQLTVETLEQPMPQQHNTMHLNHPPHRQPQQSNDSTIGGDPLEGDSAQGLPTESQLVLVCLDYLRDLRRAYPAEDLRQIEGLNADYLSLAVFALSRCFTRPESLAENNDCMMDPLKQTPLSPRHHHTKEPLFQEGAVVIPSMSAVNHEILYVENPHMEEEDADQKKEDKDDSDPYTWYDYDDMHNSNVHRFFPLAGLASGPSLKGPLTLGELVAAGLAGLGARSRLEAEKDMIQSPLFDQFVQAVKSKGFFMDPDNDIPLVDADEERQRVMRQQRNYDDRYRKVVAKFRNKLAMKAESPSKPGTPMSNSASSQMKATNWLALSSADRQRRRREQALEQSRWRKSGGSPHTPDRFVGRGAGPSPRVSPRFKSTTSTPDRVTEGPDTLTPHSQVDHPMDLEQAERSKAEGNVFMQKKMYPQAVQSYTHALKISPNGPSSHVYFSNRAAALLSMKKFGEAILDSERSLALKPDYGKAHARLGLAHFLSGNYRQAMEAYTVSLKYDPNNASSKSYLEKAAKRLAEGGSSSHHQGPIQSSFSLVSEWESSQRQQHQTSHPPQQLPPQDDGRPKHDQQRDAEKFKAKGNAFMAHREYTLALEAYTSAIKTSPNGPQSHVYYSNRAAALCYLERYSDAIADSEKSLELNPNYGKAHARLGLSRFFLQDYAGAVAAYTAALKHDPDNAASKSYLAKAKAKLEGRSSSRPSSRNPSPAPSHRRHASGMS